MEMNVNQVAQLDHSLLKDTVLLVIQPARLAQE